MNVAATVQGLSKSFGGSVVLDGIDLELPRGQTTAIVGSSGCGKTTLLRLIAGFETPDAGSVDIDGTQVSGPGVFVPAHRREVGFVAQDGALFPHLTVGQNIAYGLPGVRRGGAARRRVARRGSEGGTLSLLLAHYPGASGIVLDRRLWIPKCAAISSDRVKINARALRAWASG